MARSAIAGIAKQTRRLEATKKKELKKLEDKKVLDKAKADRDKLKKEIETLRKKR